EKNISSRWVSISSPSELAFFSGGVVLAKQRPLIPRLGTF
ncbi:hypothetical protein A2U01_0106057, partial [Trifolium medium]|nr:hypothetical protein [Trifolium medium]